MINGERFAEIWANRGMQNDVSKAMTDAEREYIRQRWITSMPSDTCWDDAFHAEWRRVDLAGHAKHFKGTFYESAETMRADDEDGEISP